MFKSVVAVLFFTSLIITQSNCQSDSDENSIECGINQVYRVCAIPCLPTCENPNPPQCRPRKCLKRCQCEWGYVEDGNGNCILPEDCTNNADNGETKNRRRRHLNVNRQMFAKWRSLNFNGPKFQNLLSKLRK